MFKQVCRIECQARECIYFASFLSVSIVGLLNPIVPLYRRFVSHEFSAAR